MGEIKDTIRRSNAPSKSAEATLQMETFGSRFRIVWLLVVLGIFASFAYAHAQQVTVLKNVNLIDGTGAAAQRNRTIVITGDRIQSVSLAKAHVPSNATVIDMQGWTIM